MPGPIRSKWRSGGARAASRSPHTARICGAGGHWDYTMHGPDGTDYPNKTQYFEVEEHAKLVYDHGGNDDRPPMFRVTARSQKRRQDQDGHDHDAAEPEAAEETAQVHQEGGRRFDLGSIGGVSGERVVGQRTIRDQSDVRCVRWKRCSKCGPIRRTFRSGCRRRDFDLDSFGPTFGPAEATFYFMTGGNP